MKNFNMNISNYKKGWLVGALILSLILAFLKIDILMALIVMSFFGLSYLALREKNVNVFFFFFIISFFIFLVSGDFAEQIFAERYWLRFSEEANTHSKIVILLGAIFLGIGYILPTIKLRVSTTKALYSDVKQQPVDKYKSIRKASLIIFYITYLILIVNTVDKGLWVLRYGYVESYLSYTTFLPLIIAELGDFAFISLLVYFATLPDKKNCKGPIILWVVYAILSLLAGYRSLCIYNCIFILSYVLYRNRYAPNGDIWIKKKSIIVLIIVVPLLFIFLQLYTYIRVDKEIEFESFGNTIVEFFVNIGSSSKVIKYGYEYRDIISCERKFFSFGSVLNYFKYSIFSLFNEIPAGHSVEFAMGGYSFAHYLSYLVMPEKFLAGEGLGSSFLAELYADFGYIGIIIGSIIYGYIFKMWKHFKDFSWSGRTILLYMSFELLAAPRASYDAFLSVIINVKFIVLLIGIYIFSKLLRKS